MKRGARNKRIELQQAVAAKAASGAGVPEWTVFAGLWAHIRTLSGHERFGAGQPSATLTHEVSIAYIPGVTPALRVLYDARIFDIKDVRDVDEAHLEIRMLCKEAV